MTRTAVWTALFLGAVGLAMPARAEIVYQNENPNYEFFQPIAPGEEIGDDVTLAGTDRFVTGFTVPVTNSYVNPFAASFTARFYAPDQDGMPGTQLWQGTATLADAGPGSDVTLNFGSPNVTVPDWFIWTLTANTVPPADPSNDEAIGVLLNDVPQVGSSDDLFYYNPGDGSGWTVLNYQPDQPDLANFQATVTASVPEPAAFGTLALIALTGLSARRRRA